MDVKDTANPVGQIIDNEHIDMFVDSMKALWDQTKQKSEWWKPWKQVNFTPITDFLIKCLDDLIAYVDTMTFASGADKKATVLAAVGRIYDYIVREALPIWMVPFAGTVRAYILYVLISTAIDWIVEKYRNGDWRKKNKPTIEAQWIKLHVQMFGVPLGGHRPKF
jgi:hypothetical protein